MNQPEESLRDLHDDLRLVRDEIGALTVQVEELRRRTECLSALQNGDDDTVTWIQQLERVLDVDRTAAHVRQAVTQVPLVERPLSHAYVMDLLPSDVYDALVAAIPPAEFFNGRADEAQSMRVPPRLAPTESIVSWGFLTEIVLRSLSPALVERFSAPLASYAKTAFPALPPFGDWNVEISLSEGRFVRRLPGYAGAPAPHREWDLLTGVLCLARPGDDERFGSRVYGELFPFRANCAVVFAGGTEALEYASIPPDTTSGTERYTYEFGIGPTRTGRRRLSSRLSSYTD